MDITNIKPDIRHLYDIKEVIFDKDWLKTAPNLELYYMYRDLAENEDDKQKITKANLRYDITVMQPQMLGKEFNKTAGHDHPLVPGTKITYPEIYEVLEGEIIFLLQDSEKDKIKDVFAIKAEQSDKVIIPPSYEHLMINASAKEAKTANWLCREFPSGIYKPFRAKHGFSYYCLSEVRDTQWLKNPNYSQIPELKFKKPNRLLEQFSISEDEPMYNLVNDLSKLAFLKTPQDYEWK